MVLFCWHLVMVDCYFRAGPNQQLKISDIEIEVIYLQQVIPSRSSYLEAMCRIKRVVNRSYFLTS